MKNLLFVFVFAALTSTLQSQELKNSQSNPEGLATVDLPGVVIKNAGKDFSVYLPDRNPDKNIIEMQNKFIGYNLGKEYEGYDNFLVILESKTGTLTATYNETGKLTKVVEKYNDVKLPSEVIVSVYKSYPGWQIITDKYHYHQTDGDILKKEYALKLKNENQTKNITVKPNGDITKG